MGVSDYTCSDLEDMLIWKDNQIQNRILDAIEARQMPDGSYSLILHPANSEYEDFQTIRQHQVPSFILEAMTKLVVVDEIAEPNFLLVINRVESVFDNPEEARRLQEYDPMAMYLLNCLMGIMDISQVQSLNLMLMTCVQQKMKEMHEGDPRSTASIVVSLKMTPSDFLADVVRLGLMRGSM
jgi:hypothetical protein